MASTLLPQDVESSAVREWRAAENARNTEHARSLLGERPDPLPDRGPTPREQHQLWQRMEAAVASQFDGVEAQAREQAEVLGGSVAALSTELDVPAQVAENPELADALAGELLESTGIEPGVAAARLAGIGDRFGSGVVEDLRVRAEGLLTDSADGWSTADIPGPALRALVDEVASTLLPQDVESTAERMSQEFGALNRADGELAGLQRRFQERRGNVITGAKKKLVQIARAGGAAALTALRQRATILAGEPPEVVPGVGPDAATQQALHRDLVTVLAAQLDHSRIDIEKDFGFLDLRERETMLNRELASLRQRPRSAERAQAEQHVTEQLHRVRNDLLRRSRYSVEEHAWRATTGFRQAAEAIRTWTRNGPVPAAHGEGWGADWQDGPSRRWDSIGYNAASEHLQERVEQFRRSWATDVEAGQRALDNRSEEDRASILAEAKRRLGPLAPQDVELTEGRVDGATTWSVGITGEQLDGLRDEMALALAPLAAELHDLPETAKPAERERIESGLGGMRTALLQGRNAAELGFEGLLQHQRGDWLDQRFQQWQEPGHGGLPDYVQTAEPPQYTESGAPHYETDSPDAAALQQLSDRWRAAFDQARQSLDEHGDAARDWRQQAREMLGVEQRGVLYPDTAQQWSALHDGMVDAVADAGLRSGPEAADAVTAMMWTDVVAHGADRFMEGGPTARTVAWHARELRTLPAQEAQHWRHRALGRVLPPLDASRGELRQSQPAHNVMLDGLANIARENRNVMTPVMERFAARSIVDPDELMRQAPPEDYGATRDSAQRALDTLFGNAIRNAHGDEEANTTSLAEADSDTRAEAFDRADSILGPTLREYQPARELMAHKILNSPNDRAAWVQLRVQLQRQMSRLAHISAGAGPEPGAVPRPEEPTAGGGASGGGVSGSSSDAVPRSAGRAQQARRIGRTARPGPSRTENRAVRRGRMDQLRTLLEELKASQAELAGVPASVLQANPDELPASAAAKRTEWEALQRRIESAQDEFDGLAKEDSQLRAQNAADNRRYKESRRRAAEFSAEEGDRLRAQKAAEMRRYREKRAAGRRAAEFSAGGGASFAGESADAAAELSALIIKAEDGLQRMRDEKRSVSVGGVVVGVDGFIADMRAGEVGVVFGGDDRLLNVVAHYKLNNPEDVQGARELRERLRGLTAVAQLDEWAGIAGREAVGRLLADADGILGPLKVSERFRTMLAHWLSEHLDDWHGAQAVRVEMAAYLAGDPGIGMAASGLDRDAFEKMRAEEASWQEARAGNQAEAGAVTVAMREGVTVAMRGDVVDPGLSLIYRVSSAKRTFADAGRALRQLATQENGQDVVDRLYATAADVLGPLKASQPFWDVMAYELRTNSRDSQQVLDLRWKLVRYLAGDPDGGAKPSAADGWISATLTATENKHISHRRVAIGKALSGLRDKDTVKRDKDTVKRDEDTVIEVLRVEALEEARRKSYSTRDFADLFKRHQSWAKEILENVREQLAPDLRAKVESLRQILADVEANTDLRNKYEAKIQKWSNIDRKSVAVVRDRIGEVAAAVQGLREEVRNDAIGKLRELLAAENNGLVQLKVQLGEQLVVRARGDVDRYLELKPVEEPWRDALAHRLLTDGVGADEKIANAQAFLERLRRLTVMVMAVRAGAGPAPDGDMLPQSAGGAGSETVEAPRSESTGDVVGAIESGGGSAAGTFGLRSQGSVEGFDQEVDPAWFADVTFGSGDGARSLDAEPGPGTPTGDARVGDAAIDDAESDFDEAELEKMRDESLERLERLRENGEPSESSMRATGSSSRVGSDDGFDSSLGDSDSLLGSSSRVGSDDGFDSPLTSIDSVSGDSAQSSGDDGWGAGTFGSSSRVDSDDQFDPVTDDGAQSSADDVWDVERLGSSSRVDSDDRVESWLTGIGSVSRDGDRLSDGSGSDAGTFGNRSPEPEDRDSWLSSSGSVSDDGAQSSDDGWDAATFGNGSRVESDDEVDSRLSSSGSVGSDGVQSSDDGGDARQAWPGVRTSQDGGARSIGRDGREGLRDFGGRALLADTGPESDAASIVSALSDGGAGPERANPRGVGDPTPGSLPSRGTGRLVDVDAIEPVSRLPVSGLGAVSEGDLSSPVVRDGLRSLAEVRVARGRRMGELASLEAIVEAAGSVPYPSGMPPVTVVGARRARDLLIQVNRLSDEGNNHDDRVFVALSRLVTYEAVWVEQAEGARRERLNWELVQYARDLSIITGTLREGWSIQSGLRAGAGSARLSDVDFLADDNDGGDSGAQVGGSGEESVPVGAWGFGSVPLAEELTAGLADPLAEELTAGLADQGSSSIEAVTPAVLREAAERLRAAEPRRPARTDADKQLLKDLDKAVKDVTKIRERVGLRQLVQKFRAEYKTTWDSVRLVAVHAAAGTAAARDLLVKWGFGFGGRQGLHRDDVATLLADVMQRVRELGPAGPEEKLTNDQWRIVPYLAEGMNDQEIRRELGWAQSRVDTAVAGMPEVLGLRNHDQVVKWAFDQRSSGGVWGLEFTAESLRRAKIVLLAAEPRPARSEEEQRILADLVAASTAVEGAYDGSERARRMGENTWAGISVLARHALAGRPEALELIKGSEPASLVVETMFEDGTVEKGIKVSAAELVDSLAQQFEGAADSGGSGGNAGQKRTGPAEVWGDALAAAFRAGPGVLLESKTWLDRARPAVEAAGVQSKSSSQASFEKSLPYVRKSFGSGPDAAGWVVARSGKYMFVPAKPNAAVSDAVVSDGDSEELAGGRQGRLNWDAVLNLAEVKVLAEFVENPRSFISLARVDALHGRKRRSTSHHAVGEINGLLLANSAGYIFGVNDEVWGKGYIYATTGAEGDRLLSRDEIPALARTPLRTDFRWDGWELLVGNVWRVWLSDGAGRLLSDLQAHRPRLVDESSTRAVDELNSVGAETEVGELVARDGGNLWLEPAGHAATLTELSRPELGEKNYRAQEVARRKWGLSEPGEARGVKRKRRAERSAVQLASFKQIDPASFATPAKRLLAFYQANPSRPIPMRILNQVGWPEKLDNPVPQTTFLVQHAVVQKSLGDGRFGASGWIVGEHRGDETAYRYVPAMPVADIAGRTGHRFTAVDWGKLLEAVDVKMLHSFASEPMREFSRADLRNGIWGPNSDVKDYLIDSAVSRVNVVLRRHGAGIIISHSSVKKRGGEVSWWYTTTGAPGDRLVDPSMIGDLVTRVRPRGSSPRGEGLLMTTPGWWGWLKRDEFEVMRALLEAEPGEWLKPDVFEEPWDKISPRRLGRIKRSLNAVLIPRPGVEVDRERGVMFVPGPGAVDLKLEVAGESWVGGVWTRERVLSAVQGVSA
ncbi:hypothetical protein AB0H34_44195, partial [Saccharopolyspora shandongensis]|uniref:hypothetical protein n=1 Tax=Saccharopolyspora shandongensis TaxID=418495 RepID=UPI0033D7372F